MLTIRLVRTARALVGTAVAALALSAGAQRAARMALPEGLGDRNERVTATGFGGLNQGR